jgi:hypothetical protein
MRWRKGLAVVLLGTLLLSTSRELSAADARAGVGTATLAQVQQHVVVGDGVPQGARHADGSRSARQEPSGRPRCQRRSRLGLVLILVLAASQQEAGQLWSKK